MLNDTTRQAYLRNKALVLYRQGNPAYRAYLAKLRESLLSS